MLLVFLFPFNNSLGFYNPSFYFCDLTLAPLFYIISSILYCKLTYCYINGAISCPKLEPKLYPNALAKLSANYYPNYVPNYFPNYSAKVLANNIS